jgi:hypothetical protein
MREQRLIHCSSFFCEEVLTKTQRKRRSQREEGIVVSNLSVDFTIK